MKLVAIAFALVCNTIEPMHHYHEKKLEAKKWGLPDYEHTVFLDRSCDNLVRSTEVEVIEQTPAPDYPFIIKLRYAEPNKLVYDENGKIIGKGVTHEVYGEVSDFASELPKYVPPKPSPEILARRKRIEELKQTWGLPGAAHVTEE